MRINVASVLRVFLLTILVVVTTQQSFAATYIVTNTTDAAANSLRDCINQANAIAGPHTIRFSVAGTGTITLASSLPPLQQNILIDGTTSGPYSLWNPVVTLSGFGIDCVVAAGAGSRILGIAIINTGANAISIVGANNITVQDCLIGTDGTTDLGAAAIGIVIINSTGSSVRRCIVSGNNAHGILAQNSPNTIVSGNYIGTNKTGTTAIPNNDHAIYIQENCSNSKIGGISVDSMNVICGNGSVSYGIFIIGAVAQTNIRIVGNYLGLNAIGSAALGSLQYGIIDQSNASTLNGLYILKNVISGSLVEGMTIGVCANVIIKGNYLGTDATGTTTIANLDNNIELRSTNGAIIGGTTVAERNVISGSGSSGKHGIILQAVTNNCTIKGNYIGTNASGTAITGGGIKGYGIVVKGNNNIIGGVAAGELNIISGVAEVGVLITDGSNNQIIGNYIGVDASLNPLGNGYAGIMVRKETGIAVQDNIIASNVIAYNGSTYPTNPANATWIAPTKGPGIGISVKETGISNIGAIQNRIKDNLIYCNAGLGISLNRNETTPGYGNNNKAAPVIDVTSSNTNTFGTATPGDEIQVFANPTNCGSCQGEVLLGTVITDGAANWSLPVHANYYNRKITATARDVSNNTSEFTVCTDPTLPVEFVTFAATQQSAGIALLKWTVAIELNNDYFTVEKSVDGVHFFSIGTIDGAGSSAFFKEYKLLDENFTANAYYRIKQTDFDGKSSYTRIRFLELSADHKLVLYPNPATEELNISWQLPSTSVVSVVLTNTLSQVVSTQTYTTQEGFFDERIDLTTLPAGVYLVSVVSANQSASAKIIKQ